MAVAKTVIYLIPAVQALRKHRAEAKRIMAKVADYASNPAAFPKVKTLAGGDGFKRLRVGDFRVIFRESAAEIEVAKIGPRDSIYD